MKKTVKEYAEKFEKREGIESAADVVDLAKEMVKATLQEMFQGEISHHLGYKKHERSNSDNARNGKTTKTLKTAMGAMDVDIPRDRKSEFEPALVKKHQTMIGDLEDRIISMYAKGITLRDINAHLQDIYGFEVSPSQLSDITDKVIPLITEWQARALDSLYPVIYMDAIHYKVRQDGKIISKAVYICLGVRVDGKKDILGLWVGESESSRFWLSVCNELKNRGVEDIFIACIDGLPGLSDAIKIVFPKTEVQLCIVHQIRNSMRYVSWKDYKRFLKDLKAVYQAPDETAALENLDLLEKEWEIKYPMVIKSWRNKWEDLSTYFKYPYDVRRIIYTTNPLEGLNRQIRKVTKTKSVFPTDQSVQKAVFLACRDIMKKWTMPVRNWGNCLSQFSIYFEGRLNLEQISL